MGMPRGGCAVSVLIVLFACNEEPGHVTAAPARSAPSATPAPAAAPHIPRSQVESLLERWRAAQIRGDFKTYAALYHPAFGGTKRVGDKTFRFDRTRWLADRKKLFHRDVNVAVRDVRVVTGERTALVTFTQEWSAGAFRDVGPKRIEMLLSQGKFLITSEQMLESNVVQPEQTKDQPPPEEVSLLLSLQGKYGAVLRVGAVDTKGRARRISPPNETIDHFFEKDVSPAMTKPLEGWIGRTMNLYEANKLACTGRVTGFSAVGGILGSDEVELDTPAERKADAAWDWLPNSAKHLVAIVEPENRQCKAQWARAAHLPAPAMFDKRDLLPEELTLARKNLVRTPAARWSQVRYEGWVRDERNAGTSGDLPAHWMDIRPYELFAAAFSDPVTKATYTTIELSTGERCAYPGGYALGFFKVTVENWIAVTGDGDPRDVFPTTPYWGIAPHTVIIPHPGGHPILIADNALYAQTKWGFVPIITVGQVRTICGC